MSLFLDDLDQHHLAATDDVLNLVAAAQRHAVFTVFVVIAAAASAAALAVVVDAPTPATPAIAAAVLALFGALFARSEEHTSELQSLMHISYDVFCLQKKIHFHKNN